MSKAQIQQWKSSTESELSKNVVLQQLTLCAAASRSCCFVAVAASWTTFLSIVTVIFNTSHRVYKRWLAIAQFLVNNCNTTTNADSERCWYYGDVDLWILINASMPQLNVFVKTEIKKIQRVHTTLRWWNLSDEMIQRCWGAGWDTQSI